MSSVCAHKAFHFLLVSRATSANRRTDRQTDSATVIVHDFYKFCNAIKWLLQISAFLKVERILIDARCKWFVYECTL